MVAEISHVFFPTMTTVVTRELYKGYMRHDLRCLYLRVKVIIETVLQFVI